MPTCSQSHLRPSFPPLQLPECQVQQQSRSAVALLTTLLPAYTTSGISKMHGTMWLVAATCSGRLLSDTALAVIAETTDEVRRAAAQAGVHAAAPQSLDVLERLKIIDA